LSFPWPSRIESIGRHVYDYLCKFYLKEANGVTRIVGSIRLKPIVIFGVLFFLLTAVWSYLYRDSFESRMFYLIGIVFIILFLFLELQRFRQRVSVVLNKLCR
jgi:hypothetical protein